MLGKLVAIVWALRKSIKMDFLVCLSTGNQFLRLKCSDSVEGTKDHHWWASNIHCGYQTFTHSSFTPHSSQCHFVWSCFKSLPPFTGFSNWFFRSLQTVTTAFVDMFRLENDFKTNTKSGQPVVERVLFVWWWMTTATLSSGQRIWAAADIQMFWLKRHRLASSVSQSHFCVCVCNKKRQRDVSLLFFYSFVSLPSLVFMSCLFISSIFSCLSF